MLIVAAPAAASHKGCGLLGLFACPHAPAAEPPPPPPPPPPTAPEPGGDENANVPSPPPGGKLMGFNSSLSASGTMTAVQEYGLTQNAGANTHRLGVSWYLAEPTRPSYGQRNYDEAYLASIDARYQELLSRGMRPIILIMSAPSWAQARNSLGLHECIGCVKGVEPDEQNIGDWTAFADLAARRWPQAAGFEIWNEPNVHWSFRPRPNAANYLRLYITAYDAIKAVNPSAAVLTGGIAGVGPTNTNQINTSLFIDMLLRGGLIAEAPDYRLSVHMAPGGEQMGAGSPWAHGWGQMLDTLRNYGDGNREIWMTETSISTTPEGYQGREFPPWGLVATPAQQRDILRRQYNRLMTMDSVGTATQRANVRAVIFHTLKDDTNHTPAQYEYGAGFLRQQPYLQPRPVYCYFVTSEPAGAPQRTHPGC